MSDQPTNCPDETYRDAYLEALTQKIAEEKAKEAHSSALGAYRATLKRWGKLGVDTEAVAFALAHRWDDEEELVLAERNKLRMLQLSGKVPNIRNRLLKNLTIQEPTTNEANDLAKAKAADLGTQSGINGISRDANPYLPGTELHVHWIEGWLSGQRVIANRMEQNAQADEPEVSTDEPQADPDGSDAAPARRGRGRPRKSAAAVQPAAAAPSPRRSIADSFQADRPEDVRRVVAEDDADGEMPSVVH
jgi:ribosome modulation factor